MNKLFKYSAFFVSYTPLWVSILYVDLMSVLYHKTPNKWTEIISISLILLAYPISISNMIRTMRSFNKENSERLRIKEVKEQKTAALEYVLTFVLPMLAFEFTQWENCLLFVLYFLVLSYLALKHNLLGANIVFEVFNYRFYDVTLQNGNNLPIMREVISKQRLENMKEEEIYLRSMHNGFWFDVSNTKVIPSSKNG